MVQVKPLLARGFQGYVRWPIVRVGEVAALHYGKALTASSRKPGAVRVYGSNGQCGWHDTPLGDGPTVILGRKGQGPLGVEWCPWPFWVIDTAYHVTVDSQRIGLRYFYFLTKFIGLNHLKDGTSNPSLNRDVFGQQCVPLPPLPIQRRIAGILSAYDDLIENNQRRIKILEEMARSLYREWFVHFHFPGHDKVKMVPSPLGPIPQGWEVVTLKDVTSKIGSGATPRGGREAYKTEGVRLIRSLNVYDYQFEFSGLAFIDEAQAAELDNVTVAARDILLNITGASVARCCMVPSYVMPARVNQHVAIVRTDQGRADPYYVLDTINSGQNKQQLLAFAQGGATREALTKETIESFPVILPPRLLLDKYGKCAGALHAQRETLECQTQNLRRTRDLLLPRLLSGQVQLTC